MKRTVEFDGTVYKVKSDKIEIPDFDDMSRIAVLQWLSRETYARGSGIRTKPNPLAGYGGSVEVR